MRGEGNVESPFQLPDDDSSEFSSKSGKSKKPTKSSSGVRAVPYTVPIPVPGPVTSGQRASRRHPRDGPQLRRSGGSGALRREARMVPQGGRYRSTSPELEAVGGSVRTASALSYFPPSVAGSDPSPPSSFEHRPSPVAPHLRLIAEREPEFMEGEGSPFGSDMEETLDPRNHAQAVVDEWVASQGEVFAEETEGTVEAIVNDWVEEDTVQ